jgi:hypothetical protein
VLVFYADTPQEHHQNILDFIKNEIQRAENELVIDKTKAGLKARAARIGSLNQLSAYLHGSIVEPNKKA